MALLGANQLEIAIVHDSAGTPDQRIATLVRDKLIAAKAVVTYGEFVPTPSAGSTKAGAGQKQKGKPTSGSTSQVAADVEDMLSVALYIELFNATFATQLAGRKITEAELPAGERIVDRLTRFLDSEHLAIRPSGGFNHYAVASYLAANPPNKIDAATLDRFAALFDRINPLFSKS